MTEPASRPRSTRRLASVRHTRPFLFRYTALWVLLSLALIVFAGVTSYLLFAGNWDSLIAANPSLADDYAAMRSRFLLGLGVETALLIGAVVALAVMTTHRIAGPLVGLEKTCEDVAAGDLSKRFSFRRQNDELDDLADAFNDMLDSLEERVNAAEKGTSPRA